MLDKAPAVKAAAKQKAEHEKTAAKAAAEQYGVEEKAAEHKFAEAVAKKAAEATTGRT